MALDPRVTFVLGADMDDAHDVCEALDLPLRCARSVRTAGDALRGTSSVGVRVLVTRRAVGALSRPSPTVEKTIEALRVMGCTGAQVSTL